jgi:hypothetical protein
VAHANKSAIWSPGVHRICVEPMCFRCVQNCNHRCAPQGGGAMGGPPITTAKTWTHLLRQEHASCTERSDVAVSSCTRRKGCASECVIMPRAVGEQLWNSGNTEWGVAAGYSDKASAARQDRVRVKPKRTSFRPTNGRARPGLARMVRFRE